MRDVVQVRGEVVANRRVGAYHHLTVVAPGVAELARPGQFVAMAVGGPTSGVPHKGVVRYDEQTGKVAYPEGFPLSDSFGTDE